MDVRRIVLLILGILLLAFVIFVLGSVFAPQAD